MGEFSGHKTPTWKYHYQGPLIIGGNHKKEMKLSIILLDWSVRESFHALDYLNDQSIARSDYELIWVEYFDRKVDLLGKYYQTGYLDKYLILAHSPGDYHKHEAWNVGVSAAAGDIVVLCDSDVMFKRSFMQNILDFFTTRDNSFLLIDEIRSEHKSFWPFSRPAWEEVLAASNLVNWNEEYRVTTGLLPKYKDLPLWEKMFLRNYGACLCVKKSDYLRFGGLDEHDSYLGYICGPYDLVVRMVNAGLEEHWHPSEFLLHTFHPLGNSRVDRMGPHFWYNSTTSLKHLFDGNIRPYSENNLIRTQRKQLFPESLREGRPKFSVIVPNQFQRFAQRLYDSVKNSTKFPYEVIFIGECKEANSVLEEGLTYLTFNNSLYNSLLTGCHKTAGDVIVIVSGETMFRPNSLDKLLDYQGKLAYPIIYLNAIETFTQGLIWQYSSNQFTDGKEVSMMVAFTREMLTDLLTEQDLRKLFCEGQKLGSVLDTAVHLELWHDDMPIHNDQCEQLLTTMLEISRTLFNQKTNKLKTIESLLDQIASIENSSPGTFLKYCFLKRSSLRDYYNFISTLSQYGRLDLTITGLELLIAASSILTQNINENIKEMAWSHQFLYSDIAYYLGSAHFNLAITELSKSNILKAIDHLQACLNFAPGHVNAKQLLAELSK